MNESRDAGAGPMHPGTGHCSDGAGSNGAEVDCSTVLADVWLFLDGECDEASRQRVQRHLDDCSPCLTEFGIERQLKSLLSRKCGGEQAPTGLRERLVLTISQTVVEYVELPRRHRAE